MTGVDVEHTKALEQAATPGEWVADQSSDPRQMGVWLDDATGTMIAAHTTEADAKYIAHIKNTHPALIAAVERVQALHTPWTNPIGELWCLECTRPHPCPTIRALETP